MSKPQIESSLILGISDPATLLNVLECKLGGNRLMDQILSGPTAFALHRIPPQYRALLPSVPFIGAPACWRTVLKESLFRTLIQPPLYCLRQTRSACSGAKNLKDQLWLGDLPFGAIENYGSDLQVTSPLMTLLTLARIPHVSDVRLLMAMYELCGAFSLFAPTEELCAALETARSAGARLFEEWRPVKKADGRPSGLWSRRPLVAIEELSSFANEVRTYRCGARFARCAKLVTGICASPFEVQATMFLSLPPKLGGQGFKGLENNKEIKLTSDARLLSGRVRCCYGDLFFENTTSGRPLDIECQSGLVHDRYESFISDSDRMAALQTMGIEVLPLTYDQLFNPEKYHAVCAHIAHLLGTKPPVLDARMHQMETNLRYHLFTSWNTPF